MASITIIAIIALLSVTATTARVLPINNMKNSQETTNPFEYYSNNPARNFKYSVGMKRTALLIDRLMLALQNAVNNPSNRGIGNMRDVNNYLRRPALIDDFNLQDQSQSSENGVDLQRRGDGNGSVYWHCYFNAVTCFKKK